jgi:hypothetical protein
LAAATGAVQGGVLAGKLGEGGDGGWHGDGHLVSGT